MAVDISSLERIPFSIRVQEKKNDFVTRLFFDPSPITVSGRLSVRGETLYKAKFLPSVESAFALLLPYRGALDPAVRISSIDAFLDLVSPTKKRILRLRGVLDSYAREQDTTVDYSFREWNGKGYVEMPEHNYPSKVLT